MSGLVQGLVWRSELAGAPTVVYKAVLCRLGDEANDEGHNVYPSIATIARDCMCSVATVKRVLKWLRDEDWIRVVRDEKGGRGRSTRYWINVPALRDHQGRPAAFEGVPASRSASPKGYHGDTLYEGKRVSPETKRVSPEAKRVSPDDTLPLRPINTLEARGARVRPEGRTPRAEPEAVTVSDQDMVEAINSLVDDLATPVDRASFDAWAGLVLALVKRREQDLARAWLSRQAGVCVHPGKLIMASKPFTKERIEQAFGGLLREHGWQVAVAGSG